MRIQTFRVQRFRGSRVKNPEPLNGGTLVLGFMETTLMVL
jgi:hypothetical protein